jgi:MFS transporter, PPP family, 3-phenylpropionic acid transporter
MTGIRIKAIYLSLYMAFATWRVFYNVYLDRNGFSGTEIGIINALIQASLVIFVPVWGIIADKRGIRPTLRIAVLLSAILIFFLGDILSLRWLIFYMLLLTVFHHPLGPLVDALAVQFAKPEPKRYNYGNLRLWGSLGWAVASVPGGYLFSVLDLKYIFPVAALLFLLTILFIGIPFHKQKKIFRPDFQPISLKKLIENRALFIFIGILFIYGVVCSPVNAYINLYFSELGVTNSVIGWAYTIQAGSEIPFFIIGNFLVKRMGSQRVILISMAVMVLRMFIYGFLPLTALALIMGVFQGITLSFFLVGVVDYIHRQLPDGRDATAQSLIWGLYFGIGHTVGNLLTGYLKDTVGMIGVMHYFAWLALLVLLLSGFYFALREK